MGETLRGLGVGAGVAVGPIAKCGAPPELPEAHAVDDVDTEARRAREALVAVSADLAGRAVRCTDPTTAAVLDALSMIAADPDLDDEVRSLIEARTDAPHAVHAAFEGYRELLAQAGGYLAERAGDLADIRDRVIAVVLGVPVPGIPDAGEPFVLVADDLSPVDTAAIDTGTVLALVTERGGATSHTAIVARALGLPCVVACPGVMALRDGTVVAVDAVAGTVEVGVDDARVEELRTEGTRREERLAAVRGPGRTADGRRIALLHNIGAATDLDGVVDGTFEGVGLFRTELLFLDRTERPGVAEQREAYAAVLRAAAGRKVVVRTLDAGADKPLPFLPRRGEANPALGVRGLRLARELPDLLDDQLRALAAATGDVPGADVWVMAPMVSTPEETAAFVARARDAGLAKAGVMVEVPAAALRARELLVECDFLSVGTNDLGQYTFAADRMESALQDLLDPWQPALLGLVAACAEAGRLLDRPVGICGEAAADPDLAVVFAGMGITSLSMAARATPAVRLALAGRTAAECEEMAKLALGAVDAASARAVVAERGQPA